MNPVNPYVVVGSPNYAAPLLDFSGQQNQQQQGQQNPQRGNPQNTAGNLGTFAGNAIGNFGRGIYNYLNGATGNPLNALYGNLTGGAVPLIGATPMGQGGIGSA